MLLKSPGRMIAYVKLTFYGAAKTVTGSCYLLEAAELKILVDCGLFQGRDEDLNEKELGFDPAKIDLMLLTHAHIDHSGRIPYLVKKGFQGRILATPATVALCRIMLLDSAHIQEMEAEWLNRKRMRSGGKPVEPLYTVQDATNSLPLFESISYNNRVMLSDSVTIRFLDAGHILGSAIIEVTVQEDSGKRVIVFSGDLGQRDKPIIRDPAVLEAADYILMESTYGDRRHEYTTNKEEILKEAIVRTVKRGGNLLIPAFAVERTQEILYALNDLVESGTIQPIPVYVDSPMAVAVTRVFKDNLQVYDQETRARLASGDNPFEFEGLKLAESVEESKAINEVPGSKIIISASGMCNAGRIKHHLKHNLWRPESTVAIVGFQAPGTLGRALIEGAERVTIFGEEVAVKAEIVNIDGFSAHADENGLIEWVSHFTSPRKVFLVHGEPESTQHLRRRIVEELGLEVEIPELNEVFDMADEVVVKPGGLEPLPKQDLSQRLYDLQEETLRLLRAIHTGQATFEPSKIEPVLQSVGQTVDLLRRIQRIGG